MWEGWTRVSSVLTPVSVTLSWMWPNEAQQEIWLFPICSTHPSECSLIRRAQFHRASRDSKIAEQLLKHSLYPPLPEGPQVTEPSSWDGEFSQDSNLPTTPSGHFIFRPATACIPNPDFGIF